MSITRIFRGTAMDLEQERKFEQAEMLEIFFADWNFDHSF